MKVFCPLLVAVLFSAAPVFGATLGDCLWGGSNEETAYTSTFIPGMGGVSLAQATPPAMNLGAPPPAIPVQATPGSWNTTGTQAVSVPQATIPTITVPVGPVGSVGLPATSAMQPAMPLPQNREIIYVLPGDEKKEELCIDGKPGIPATAVKIVPAGTPGAVPVALKTVSVVRPRTDYHWSYSPIREQTNTLVKVVNPRTGKVVRTYCKEDEQSTFLPWLHRKEIVSYETVTVKIAEPISLNQSASQGIPQNIPQEISFGTVQTNTAVPPVVSQSRYPEFPQAESGTTTTVILP